jgi:hypothetical protein
MGRTKRTSSKLEAAKLRLAGLQSITPAPDMGGDLTVAGFAADITACDTDLIAYNKMLSDVDEFKNRYDDKESKLVDKSTRYLAAIGAKYGRDSDEYEKAGGTRKSERKRPGPRSKSSGPQPAPAG